MMITILLNGENLSVPSLRPGAGVGLTSAFRMFRVGHRRGRGPSQAEMLQMVFCHGFSDKAQIKHKSMDLHSAE